MKPVGARLRDGVHHGAAELSVFGVEAVGDKAEFLNGIQIRNEPGAQVAALADVTSIHKKCVCGLPLTVYGDIASI